MIPLLPKFRAVPIAAAALAALWLTAAPAPGEGELVGRNYEIHGHFLPGPELRVRRVPGANDPIVVRISEVYPHGTAGFRYDLVWSALEPGEYDLARLLERTDGTPAGELPELVVSAAATLPPGSPGQLEDPPAATTPTAGGYRYALAAGILVWSLAGVVLFRRILNRRRAARAAAEPDPEPTLADRLQPLLKLALRRPLDVAEKARMERLVLGFGRERLGLASAADPVVWQAMRADESTGPWLRTLENWLHRPAGSEPTGEDFRALLREIDAAGRAAPAKTAEPAASANSAAP